MYIYIYIYIQSICKIQESLMVTYTPNKRGLVLHCHGEPKLTKWKMEEDEDTRRRKG